MDTTYRDVHARALDRKGHGHVLGIGHLAPLCVYHPDAHVRQVVGGVGLGHGPERRRKARIGRWAGKRPLFFAWVWSRRTWEGQEAMVVWRMMTITTGELRGSCKQTDLYYFASQHHPQPPLMTTLTSTVRSASRTNLAAGPVHKTNERTTNERLLTNSC